MWVSASTSTVLAGTGAVILAFRDVTAERALEHELRSTKEFLERLIDSTVDAIIAADFKGQIILFNQGAERLFGYRARDVIGKKPVWELYEHGGARQIMRMLRSTSYGGVGRLEQTRREVRIASGEIVPVSMTASIVYEGEREVATVGILTDLRERIRMEQRLLDAQQKLQLSEKQALVAELAGAAAHELNQPLTSIMGYAQLIERQSEKEAQHLRGGRRSSCAEAERMAGIVKKIGKITKYETTDYVGSARMLDLDRAAADSRRRDPGRARVDRRGQPDRRVHGGRRRRRGDDPAAPATPSPTLARRRRSLADLVELEDRREVVTASDEAAARGTARARRGAAARRRASRSSSSACSACSAAAARARARDPRRSTCATASRRAPTSAVRRCATASRPMPIIARRGRARRPRASRARSPRARGSSRASAGTRRSPASPPASRCRSRPAASCTACSTSAIRPATDARAGDEPAVTADRATGSSIALRTIRLQEDAIGLRDYQARLLDSANALILGIDRSWRITVCNRALLELTGIDPRRSARPRRPRLHGERPAPAADDRVLRGARRPAPRGGHRDAADAATGPVRSVWAIAPVGRAGAPGGPIEAVVAIGQDQSKIELLQQQIVRAERLATLGELAAGVVHELNNPLTSITVYAEYLVRKLESQGAEQRRSREAAPDRRERAAHPAVLARPRPVRAAERQARSRRSTSRRSCASRCRSASTSSSAAAIALGVEVDPELPP